MVGVVADSHELSIDRALRGIPTQHQQLIRERYARLLPVLLILMRPRDIAERNRTWPGVQPAGKAATSYLVPLQARLARDVIDAYAAQADEQRQELWQLFHAYCRYGPIGLLDALPAALPELLDPNIEACVQFHRLAKHPRSNAGLYIRDLLAAYAQDLGLPSVPPFIARYAFATDRKLDRWFFPEGAATEAIPKTTRRLNLNLDYPHRRWCLGLMPLPISCLRAQRYRSSIQPWLTWICDQHTQTLMGVRLSPHIPTAWDVVLTLRWSIWHYDAAWWFARGVPDALIVPPAYAAIAQLASAALPYLRTIVQLDDTATAPIAPSREDAAVPPLLTQAIAVLEQRQRVRDDLRGFTLAELRMLLLETIAELQRQDNHAVAVPQLLQQQGVSLPWSAGIAAAGLLPPVQHHIAGDGTVVVHGVPYEAATHPALVERPITVRIDPDDARQIALTVGRAQVIIARAVGFEHVLAWWELVDKLPEPGGVP